MRSRLSRSRRPGTIGLNFLTLALALLGSALHGPLVHAEAEESAAPTAESAAASAPAGQSQGPPAARRKRLLVLDPVANHVDKETVQVVAGLLTVEIAAFEGVEVVSGADVQRILALESQKVDMGCSAESCVSEIADAMGTDLVVFGNIGRLGELYILTLSLFETAAAKSHGRVSMRTRSIEELPDILSRELPTLLRAVLPSPDSTASAIRSPSAAPEASPSPRRSDDAGGKGLIATGVMLGVGGLAGVVAGALPWLTYQAATTDALQAQDAGAYEEFLDAHAKGAGAAREYNSWGRVALWAGGVTFGIGSLLLVGATLLPGGEAAE